MVYASSKDALRRALNGVASEIQGTDFSEVAYETVLDKISLYFLAVLGSLGQDKPGIMALVQKFLDVLKAKQVKGKVNCQLLDEYFSNVLFRCGNLSAYSS